LFELLERKETSVIFSTKKNCQHYVTK